MVLAAGLLAVGVAGQASAAACENPAAQPPDPGSFTGFNGVAATGGCNAWAVGGYGYAGYGLYNMTLIEHWDGTAWTIQSSPSPGVSFNDLEGVAATSSTNAWAVGDTDSQTLIEHWDGTEWSVQPSPNPDPYDVLRGVAATSPTNAWAVGYHNIGNPRPRYYTLIEHWNGTEWSIQPSPNPAPLHDYLYGVAATSPKNAWAVGTTARGAGGRTVIEHWNGKAWKVQPSPSRGASKLYGVAATSPTNAWAVGYYHYKRGQAVGVLIEHWGGQRWKIQPTPKLPGFSLLSGVVATSSTNAWAAGYSQLKNGSVYRTVIEHWGGKRWKIQRTPNPAGSTQTNVLSGVAATSPTNAWTAGQVRIRLPWRGRVIARAARPALGRHRLDRIDQLFRVSGL